MGGGGLRPEVVVEGPGEMLSSSFKAHAAARELSMTAFPGGSSPARPVKRAVPASSCPRQGTPPHPRRPRTFQPVSVLVSPLTRHRAGEAPSVRSRAFPAPSSVARCAGVRTHAAHPYSARRRKGVFKARTSDNRYSARKTGMPILRRRCPHAVAHVQGGRDPAFRLRFRGRVKQSANATNSASKPGRRWFPKTHIVDVEVNLARFARRRRAFRESRRAGRWRGIVRAKAEPAQMARKQNPTCPPQGRVRRRLFHSGCGPSRTRGVRRTGRGIRQERPARHAARTSPPPERPCWRNRFQIQTRRAFRGFQPRSASIAKR